MQVYFHCFNGVGKFIKVEYMLQEVDFARTIWVLKDRYVWIETGGGMSFQK